MPPTAVIVCSTERLYPYDDATTFACGLNISVATDDSSATEPRLLRPWTWEDFYRVRVFIDDGAAGQFLDQPIEALTWRGKSVDKKRSEPGYTALIKHLEDLSRNADFSLKAKSADHPETVELNTGTKTTISIKWPAFLADLSVRPAPVPHVL